MDLSNKTRKQLRSIIASKDRKYKKLLEDKKVWIAQLATDKEELDNLLKKVRKLEESVESSVPLSAVKSQNIYNRIKFFLVDYLEVNGVFKATILFSFLFIGYILNTVLIAKGTWCYLGGDAPGSWGPLAYKVTICYYFVSLLLLVSKVRHTMSKR